MIKISLKLPFGVGIPSFSDNMFLQMLTYYTLIMCNVALFVESLKKWGCNKCWKGRKLKIVKSHFLEIKILV